MPSAEEITAAVRVIARDFGREPDANSDIVDADGRPHPHWQEYWEVARDALIAAEKMREQGF